MSLHPTPFIRSMLADVAAITEDFELAQESDEFAESDDEQFGTIAQMRAKNYLYCIDAGVI